MVVFMLANTVNAPLAGEFARIPTNTRVFPRRVADSKAS